MPNYYGAFLFLSMGEEYFWFGFHVDEGALIIGMACLFIDFCRVLIFIGEFVMDYMLIELFLPHNLNENAIGIVLSWIQTHISFSSIKILLILWTISSNLSTWSMIYGNLNKKPLLCWPFVIMSAISVFVISSLSISLLCVTVYNFGHLPIGFTFFVAISILIIADLNCFVFFKTINRSRLSLTKELKEKNK